MRPGGPPLWDAMAARGSHTPAWLFSFVDLAFLLLIAMTQVASRSDAPDLGEVIVPRLQDADAAELPSAVSRRWQLRVHPDDVAHSPPFELVAAGDASGDRLELRPLRERLEQLEATGAAKPLLAPHRDSRSEDLLEAADLLERLWPRQRRATVLAGR